MPAAAAIYARISSDPDGTQLGVRRQVWLGTLAATRPGASQIPIRRACGRFVDHYTFHGGDGPNR